MDDTERKRAEDEHREHVRFLESMDRVNRAIQGTGNLEQLMNDVLDAVLEIFACDRAWLLYPCDPDAPSWRAVMEHTRLEFPGAAARGRDLPMTVDAAEVARAVLGSRSALPAGPGHERQVKPEIAERFGVQSEMLMALRPKGDQPYLFGLHQCSSARSWTKEEQRLFEEIGHRLTDALTSLLVFRSLRESERRLEEAQRVAHLGYWDRDLVANRVVLSEESWRIFDIGAHERPADLAEWNKRWQAFIHPEDRPRVLAAVQASLAGGPRYDVEFRIIRKDGDIRVIHSQGDVIHDDSGRAVRMFGTQQDITALRESEQRLQAAQRLAQVGWWERDFTTQRVALSEEACRIFGVQPVDLPQWQERWVSLIHPDDRQKTTEANEIALRGGPRYDVEYRVVRPDGTVRVVRSQGDVTRDEGGRPIRQFGALQDITELRETQHRLEAAQHLARVGWWECDRVADRIIFSDEVAEIFGIAQRDRSLDHAEWMKLLPTIIHPDDWGRVSETAAALRGGAHYDLEFRVVHGDGTVRVVTSHTDVTRDESGRPVRDFGAAQDITELRQAEDELRASEARFRTFVDRATDAFFLMDAQYRVVDVNRQACESLGFSREELIGMRPLEFDVALDEPAIERLAQRAQSGEIITFETRHRRKDGMVFPVEIRAGTFQQGGELFYLALARDISERKLAEEIVRAKDNALQIARTELAHVSRLTTLGELTASIAHEVNQPLGAMVTNAAACARWLAAEPPDMEEARAALDNIVADGRRAGDIIARIRALTKRQMPRMESLDVNREILQVVELAKDELRSREIVLRTELDTTLPGVAGDRVQLQQVLLNLVVNAVEAMSALADRPRELTITTARSGTSAVLVEVRDSGPGLAPESVEQVFEAFYTTKPEGIGIGLSISRSIVEAHGGRLWAAPGEPHGAVFRLSLPVSDEGRS